MPNRFIGTLDPLYETIGLISACQNADKIKAETVKALNDMGIEGERFYSSYMTVYDEYFKEFKINYVPGESDALFFEGIETGMLLLILSLLLENRGLLNSVDDYEDSEINTEIISHICALNDAKPATNLKTLDQYLDFIKQFTFTDSEKWKLIQIMNNPKTHLKALCSSVTYNQKAFEKAQSKVSAPLSKLLEQYTQSVKAQDSELFGKLRKSFSKKADVYPSLAYPVSQMIFLSSCYYGLLSSLIVGRDIPDQSSMLRRLKALGDASRLEIIRLIKQRPMYNLEIAEQLNLTAATMSHHMGILLSCGFAGVTKKDSKVYYHLETETVRQFIKTLDKTLA